MKMIVMCNGVYCVFVFVGVVFLVVVICSVMFFFFWYKWFKVVKLKVCG